VYFADKASWVEWTLSSGYFPATTVTCFDGRVFFTLSETTVSDAEWNGTEDLASTLTEFNISDLFIDTLKSGTINEGYGVQIKLPVPRASYNKAALPASVKANFKLETPNSGVGIKPFPVGYVGYSQITNATDSTTGVEGTDYVFAKGNSLTTSSTFLDSSEVVQVEVLREGDVTPLYIKDATTGVYRTTDITNVGYNTGYNARDAYGTLLVCGYSANKVYKSTDNGATWDAGVLISGSNVTGICLLANGWLLACGDLTTGKVFKSTNSGATWDAGVTVGTHLAGITQLANGDVVAVSRASNKIFKSTNNGATWDAGVTVGGTLLQDVLQLADGSVVVTAYTSQKIYKSTDNGATWDAGVALGGNNPRGVCQLPNGWLLCLASSKVLKSTDNGVTWDSGTVFSGVTSRLYYSNGFVYASSVTTGTYRSADYGTTWTSMGSTTSSGTGQFTKLADVSNETVTYGVAYPCWWLSPAFTRNNIQNLKRMSHFYAVFENSSSIQTNSSTAPSWVATPKMNLAVVQNGSRTGQSSTAITDDADPFDILSTSDSGLDYYRVVYPIDGNFISFQAFVYSFDDGNWEMVGYQLDTDVSGKTNRKPYD
jgi:hypothetical protein